MSDAPLSAADADADAERRDSRLKAFEGLASVVAVGAIAFLFFNWFGAHLAFYGEPVAIDADSVSSYWTTVGVLAAAVAATVVLAARRRASRAWPWHLAVAALGVAASFLFAVTTTGTPHDDPTPPRPTYTGPHCYSGGDSSECPGG